nr:aminopeptidase P family N-terminal domain-containing protein [Alphaproteobacteria bacterium]
MLTPPSRGFLRAEFEHRMARAQARMRELELDAVLLTTEAEVRYFTGFLTQFWESPTRPWFVVLPLDGKPIAVIPEIGAAGMRTTWVEDIRTWSSPRPGDDGPSLVAGALEAPTRRVGRLGASPGAGGGARVPPRGFCQTRGIGGGGGIPDAA